MSIRYAVSGNLSNYTTCYGSLYKYLSPTTFDGITLYLRKAAVARDFPDDDENSDWNSGFLLDKKGTDYVRTMMQMCRQMGFGDYIPRTVDKIVADGCIHFSKDIPFYIVVAVTGFFRAWDGNHTELHNVYADLIKAGVEPYAAFCASQAISKVGDRYTMYTASEHSIVPYCIFNREGINKFRTWKDRLPDLKSMAEEVDRTGELNYHGRDKWFGAKFSGNDEDPDDVFYWDSADDEEQPIDEWAEICHTMKYLKSEWSPYSSIYIHFDELVEEIKEW